MYCAASELDVLALSISYTFHLYRFSISDILHIYNLGMTCRNMRLFPNNFELSYCSTTYFRHILAFGIKITVYYLHCSSRLLYEFLLVLVHCYHMRGLILVPRYFALTRQLSLLTITSAGAVVPSGSTKHFELYAPSNNVDRSCCGTIYELPHANGARSSLQVPTPGQEPCDQRCTLELPWKPVSRLMRDSEPALTKVASLRYLDCHTSYGATQASALCAA